MWAGHGFIPLTHVICPLPTLTFLCKINENEFFFSINSEKKDEREIATRMSQADRANSPMWGPG